MDIVVPVWYVYYVCSHVIVLQTALLGSIQMTCDFSFPRPASWRGRRLRTCRRHAVCSTATRRLNSYLHICLLFCTSRLNFFILSKAFYHVNNQRINFRFVLMITCRHWLLGNQSSVVLPRTIHKGSCELNTNCVLSANASDKDLSIITIVSFFSNHLKATAERSGQ